MKNIIKFIILLAIGISSANGAGFQSSLNLSIGTEIYDINQYTLNEYNFNNAQIRKTYNEIIYLDSAFRKEIFNNYEKGKIKRYQVNGLVKEYKNFVYYSNQFFFYIKQTEYGIKNQEITYFIGKNYKDLTSSYQRMSNIIK